MNILYLLSFLALLLILWASYALWTQPDIAERCALCGSVGERDGEEFTCRKCGITWEG